MTFERNRFQPVAHRVIAFTNARFYGENMELRPTQLALLNSIDDSIRFKAELNSQGSPVFDALSLYMGQRAGHSTLWRLMAAALDPEVVLVFPTNRELEIHQKDTGGVIPAPKHALTERQVFAEFNREDGNPKPRLFHEPDAPPQLPTYPYSVVVFDYAGIWHYNKSPDWHQRFRNTLRGLEERQVLTILA